MKSIVQFINEKKNNKLDFSNMINACSDKFNSIQEVINDLNKHKNLDSHKLSKNIIKGLFNGYENASFVGCVLSNNGTQGRLEDEFDYIWDNDMSYEGWPEDAMFDWDGNGCDGSIRRYIDKNGHMMIISDMDPCRIYISK